MMPWYVGILPSIFPKKVSLCVCEEDCEDVDAVLGVFELWGGSHQAYEITMSLRALLWEQPTTVT